MFHFRKLMSKGVRAFVTYKEGACIELLVGAADSQPGAAASSGKGVLSLLPDQRNSSLQLRSGVTKSCVDFYFLADDGGSFKVDFSVNLKRSSR